MEKMNSYIICEIAMAVFAHKSIYFQLVLDVIEIFSEMNVKFTKTT